MHTPSTPPTTPPPLTGTGHWHADISASQSLRAGPRDQSECQPPAVDPAQAQPVNQDLVSCSVVGADPDPSQRSKASSLSPPAAGSDAGGDKDLPVSPMLAQTRRSLYARGSSVSERGAVRRASSQGSPHQKLIRENEILQQQLALRRAEVEILSEKMTQAEEDRMLWRGKESTAHRVLHEREREVNDRENAVKLAEARACALLLEAKHQLHAADSPCKTELACVPPWVAKGDQLRTSSSVSTGSADRGVCDNSACEQRGKRASDAAREVEQLAMKLKALEQENTSLRSRLAARRKEVEMMREVMARESQARLLAEEDVSRNHQAEAHRLKQYQDRENRIRETQARAQTLLEGAQEQQQQAAERERAVIQRELWVQDSERLLVECNNHLLRLPDEEAAHARERLEREQEREAEKERARRWDQEREEARERERAREDILLQTLREREADRERERAREKERGREREKMKAIEAERERERAWMREQEEKRDGAREREISKRAERERTRLKRHVLHGLFSSASLLKV